MFSWEPFIAPIAVTAFVVFTFAIVPITIAFGLRAMRNRWQQKPRQRDVDGGYFFEEPVTLRRVNGSLYRLGLRKRKRDAYLSTHVQYLYGRE